MCVTDFDISPNYIYQQQELHVLVTVSLFMVLSITYKYLSRVKALNKHLIYMYLFGNLSRLATEQMIWQSLEFP